MHMLSKINPFMLFDLCFILPSYVFLLKGNSGEKIVTHFLLESHRPSKMMNICKKKVG